MLLMEERLFNQPEKKLYKTYKNIIEISTGQGDYYTTGSLLDYPYLK